jgi:hypothetical protein
MDCLVGKGGVKGGINGKKPAGMCVFVPYSLCSIPTVRPESLLLCDVRVIIRESGVRPPTYVPNTLKN